LLPEFLLHFPVLPERFGFSFNAVVPDIDQQAFVIGCKPEIQ
jgi:hypothetical protein